ncbi:EAL domain-containing protein [Paraburkholderia fungorum]|uniref:EAL domain-containing protein n=1 Tax=Paraburkholderia fungorum TaxID=134537 RepID=UPI0038BB342D
MAKPAVFPGGPCAQAGAFLLPAPFGDAGMREFAHADGTRGTCAFHLASLHTSSAGVAVISEEQHDAGTGQMQLNGSRENALPAISAKADPLTNEAAPQTAKLVAATPKPAEPPSGMFVPRPSNRAPAVSGSHVVERRASPDRYIVPMADYHLFLVISVVVLVLALLALLGAAAAFLYLRWFSERAILARAIRRGLRRNEFSLEYQPVFYTRTRKCIGLEVVLRWRNVVYGLRGEAWYMDKLADRRATTKIVAFILSTAERELGILANGRNLYLMVNLWASCLGNEDCLSLIVAKAKSFTSTRLVFQIKADDLPERFSSMVRLRRDKVRVALSGVRTSAAIAASMLPAGFEFIKVDRDVMGLEDSDRLQTLQAIAAMGRQLDVAVIADGIEGVAQNHAVGRAQIELAQGFFLGKAISVVQLPMLFEKLDWWQGVHVPPPSVISLSR